MKRKIKEKVALKQETKSDIQELFNELFVGELNEKIANVSSQTTGSMDVLESIKKQTVQNSNVICDRIDALREDLQCVGTVDDWGEETLISFLNQLSQIIASCKSEVDKHTVIWGTQWGETTVHELIEDIAHHLKETHHLIEGIERRTLKNGFEKIFSEFECLDAIVGTIKLINDNVKLLSDAFEEDGLIKELYNLQKGFSNDLVTCKEHITELSNKIDSVRISIEQLSNSMSETSEMRKVEISTLNDTLRIDNNAVLKQVECLMLQSKKRFTYVFAGMGFLVLTNIVMFVMLLIK